MAAVIWSEDVTALNAGFGKAKIFIPLPLAAQAHQIGAIRLGVGNGAVHQLFHVPFAARLRVDGHCADAEGFDRFPIYREFQRDGGDQSLDFAFLQREIMVLRQLRMTVIELWQQLSKIYLENKICKVDQSLVFFCRRTAVFCRHLSPSVCSMYFHN